MLNVLAVTCHYGVRPVLRELNLRINTGEVVALIGSADHHRHAFAAFGLGPSLRAWHLTGAHRLMRWNLNKTYGTANVRPTVQST